MFFSLKKSLYKWVEKNFLQGCSNYNSIEVRRKSRTKEKGRTIFQKNNIPCAKGTSFILPFKALSFVKKQGFPVVIKPNLGGFSRGSYFPIKNYKELWKALFLVKIYWPKTIIEEYLEGKNYRVTVCDGEIIAVCERFAPYIIGDGISSIEKLIDTENQTRKKMELYPVMSPLSKEKATLKYLKTQNLDLRSIPKKDKIIKLFHRIALKPGGTIHTVEIQSIPVKNQKIFQKVLQLFDARVFGIDVIMEKGIETPYNLQKCIFLEVNSRPYMKLHDFPRKGKKPNLSSYYQKLNALDIKDSQTF